MYFLAQAQLDAVPASEVKWTLAILLVLLVAAAIVIGIITSFRKPAPQRLNDEPPIKIEKSPKRFNHDLAESRHGEVTRRLDGHDAEIEQIWFTMRKEDASIREENAKKFESIMLSLGRIEGKLNK